MTDVKAQTIIDYLEMLAPLALKEVGDPTGFQLGRRDKTVKHIMVTLDVRPETVTEAIEKQVDMIIAHHPVIFRAPQNLDLANPQNKMYADLLAHDITVYAAHTNLDKTTDGMNDWLAEALQLTNIQPFNITEYQPTEKIAIFVPNTHAKILKNALSAVGAGLIGNYQACAFETSGMGSFTPNQAAKPFSGQIMQENRVAETKLEMQYPKTIRNQVIDALLKNHPYETPVYDIYELANQNNPIGLGRIGDIHQIMTVENYAQFVCQTFNISGLRMISQTPSKEIKKVAIIGGDGGKFYQKAIAAKADLLITGDVYYHTGHDMLTDGLSVLDPGHHIEAIVKPKLAQKITNWAQENQYSLKISQSEQKTDPFAFIFHSK